ncbi:MAG TPA: hypothetical protein PKH97_12115 [Tetrasphaera sp.]|uniref:hypothetical protein n=1 Tax=Nostocoides sp. TaxID=1917966 RepID=UPI002C192951|nr:hypothetical protein [Tetrasphaera sp.]HNQ07915.1 hypothetical protein [Tetrasphaera sp.]
MIQPGTPGPRLVRATAISVAAVALAALAHAGIAGMPIPPLAGALALLLTSPIAYAVAVRRIGFAGLTGCLALGQAISHVVFTAAHATAGAGMHSTSAGTVLGARHLGHSGSGAALTAMEAPTGRMLLGHLLATLLLAAALAWGERLLWGARRLLPRLPGSPRLGHEVARLPALGEGTAYVLGMGADRARVTRGPPTLSASRPARLLPQPPALPWRLCH